MKNLLLTFTFALIAFTSKAQWINSTGTGFDFDAKTSTALAFYEEPENLQKNEMRLRIASTEPTGFYTVNGHGQYYGPFQIEGPDMIIVGNFYNGRMHGRVKYYKGGKLAMVRHYREGRVIKTIKY